MQETKTEIINDRDTHQELTLEMTYKTLTYNGMTASETHVDVGTIEYSVYEEGRVGGSYTKEVVSYSLTLGEYSHYTNKHLSEIRDDYILKHYGEAELDSVDILDGYGEESFDVDGCEGMDILGMNV